LYRTNKYEEKGSNNLKSKKMNHLKSSEMLDVRPVNNGRLKEDGYDLPLRTLKIKKQLGTEIMTRKRIESALKDSEEKYKVLIETSDDMIFTVDLKGNFQFTNPALHKHIGYSKKEIKEINGFDLVHPDDLLNVQAKFALLPKGKIVNDIEYRYKTKDGSYIHISNNAVPIYDSEGNITGAFGIARNITKRKMLEEELLDHKTNLEKLVAERTAELKMTNDFLKTEIKRRKKIEEALSESERRYRSFVENFHGVAFRANRKWVPEFFHGEVEKITGYKEEEFKAGNPRWNKIIHPEDQINVFAENKKQLLNTLNKSIERNYRIIRKDGQIRWVHEHIKSIKLNPFTVEGSIYDITDFKRVEESLRKSEERFRDIVELLPEAVFEVDLEGKFTFANRRAIELSGFTQEELNDGLNCLQMFIEEDQKRVKENIEEILRGKNMGFNEYTSVKKDGSRYPVLIHSTPIVQAGKPTGLRGIIIDLSDRKLVEEAIRESEGKYRTLFEKSATSISLLDISGRIIDCNSATEELTGYSKDELTGKSFNDLKTINPKDLIMVKEKFIDLSNGMDIEPYELEIIRKDNTKRWINVTNSLLIMDGKVSGFQVISNDITERKRIEEKLRKSEAKFRSLIEKAGTGIAICDLDGNLSYANKALCNMIGYSENELIGKPFINFLHSDEIERMLELFYETFTKHETVKELEFKAIHKNGNQVIMYTKPTVFRYNEELAGFNAIITDITQRKKMEQKLKKSEEKNTALLNAIPDLMLRIHSDGTFLDYKAKSENELFKYPDKFLGKKVIEVMPEELANQTIESLKLALETGDIQIFEYKHQIKGFDYIFEVRIVVCSNNEVLAIVRDITEQKQAEIDLKSTLNEREILFNELKHRVKNNLQLLSSMIDMQILRSDNEIYSKKFQEIQSVIETIALIYSKTYDGANINEFNLNKYIEELISSLIKFKINDDLKIYYSVKGDDIQLNTDKAIPLALIVNELVFNSLKHAFVNQNEGHISITIKKDADFIKFMIQDDGIGLSSNIQINETKTLGLKLIRNLVNQLRGSIDVTTDNGTEFTLRVPVEDFGGVSNAVI
jgi:PAS domain S-box-containing protein